MIENKTLNKLNDKYKIKIGLEIGIDLDLNIDNEIRALQTIIIIAKRLPKTEFKNMIKSECEVYAQQEIH